MREETVTSTAASSVTLVDSDNAVLERVRRLGRSYPNASELKELLGYQADRRETVA